MVPAILAKVGLPFFIQILSGALSQISNPVAQSASEALGKIDTAIKSGEISPEQVAEANRHAEKMAELEIQGNQSALAEINHTMRAETASSDSYVRRMRPTFGYMMAFTWAAQMFAIAYVIVFDTEKSAFVLNAMGSLSVLGVYVYKRSEEKKDSSPRFKEIIGWNKSKR